MKNIICVLLSIACYCTTTEAVVTQDFSTDPGWSSNTTDLGWVGDPYYLAGGRIRSGPSETTRKYYADTNLGGAIDLSWDIRFTTDFRVVASGTGTNWGWADGFIGFFDSTATGVISGKDAFAGPALGIMMADQSASSERLRAYIGTAAGTEYRTDNNESQIIVQHGYTYTIDLSWTASTRTLTWSVTSNEIDVRDRAGGTAVPQSFTITQAQVEALGGSFNAFGIANRSNEAGTRDAWKEAYIDNATVTLLTAARNPDPVGGFFMSPSVTVSWDPGSDPNNSITTHKLYTDAYNAPADPNLYLVADIANTGARVSYELAALPDTKLISWRVDAVYDSGVITGVVWNFQKMLIQISQEPVDMLLWPGDTATFSTTVISPETLLYQWFKYDPALPEDQQVPLADGGRISGVNTPDLAIANVQIEDEGQYVCAIFTPATISNPIITRLANLTLYRMIAHWTFDDTSILEPADPADPNMYLDETGNYGATSVGEFVSEPGIVGGGQALRFSGGYLTIPNTGNDPGMRFDYTNMLTVSVWIKTSDMQHPGSSNDWTGLVTKGDNSWQLSRQGSNVPQVIRFRSNGSLAGTMPVADDNWHLIVGTFDGTSSKLYIDGVLDIQNTFGTALGKNTADVWIGNVRTGSNNRLYNGLMDDVRIYNYALTREDVAQMYYDVTGQTVCMYGIPAGDVNGDCAVDLEDIIIMASEWLTAGFYSPVE